ncbi:MAG: MBL fold metallo-hydrolase [Anaerolineae bacterium]
MPSELYNNGAHRCIRFDNLTGEGDVQANQFLIIHNGKGILMDPGGNKLFSALVAEMSRFLPPQKLDYIFLSHQDPDVGAGLNGYLLVCDARILVSTIWERFIPSFCTRSLLGDRLMGIPDAGMRLSLNGAELILIPAHFIHSPGNFQVYDPISKILFSGDLGASVMPPEKQYGVVKDFHAHIQYMEAFHQRYMPSSKVLKQWTAMIRDLDIERIVPQHGALFEGKAMVRQFVDWIGNMECGPDLMLARGVYSIPRE